MKTAIVTGITGQDGSYLAELLLEQNYLVVGLHRRTSTNTLERVAHLLNNSNFKLEECDLTDPSGIFNVINIHKPRELYNLAAQSHVGTSFSQPTTTFEVDTVGVLNILEAIRKTSPHTRFYQASTSEMYGFNYDTDENGNKYQDESTQLLPQSPYGVAKLASHNMVRIYRSAYGLFCCSGTLFNHESPRRGENFVTRKITKWLGRFIKWCKDHGVDPANVNTSYNKDAIFVSDMSEESFPKLRLGNIKAYRDWGHAKDYVRAMWAMLQKDSPDDYVVATGDTYSVEDFLKIAFSKFGIDFNKFIVIDPQFYRPAEVDYLRGIPNKAKRELQWTPEISFSQLVEDMVKSDQMV